MGNVKLEGHLSFSDHEMVELEILGPVRKGHFKLTTLGFRRVYFGLHRDMFGGVPWDKDLEGRGAQESWVIFEGHILQVQEQCIPRKTKTGRPGGLHG